MPLGYNDRAQPLGIELTFIATGKLWQGADLHTRHGYVRHNYDDT